jgi:hypothetical protein
VDIPGSDSPTTEEHEMRVASVGRDPWLLMQRSRILKASGYVPFSFAMEESYLIDRAAPYAAVLLCQTLTTGEAIEIAKLAPARTHIRLVEYRDEAITPGMQNYWIHDGPQKLLAKIAAAVNGPARGD